jgi:hypothetical protein
VDGKIVDKYTRLGRREKKTNVRGKDKQFFIKIKV